MDYNFLDVDLPTEINVSDLCSLNDTTCKEANTDELNAISPKSKLTKNILRHSLHFKQSYNGIEGVAKLVNSTPGATVQVPTTKYKIKKAIPPLVETYFCIQCASCKDYTMSQSTTVECHSCSRIVKTANSKYFTYLPIKPQLMNTLNKHLDDIISYDQNFHNFDGTIRDVQDGIHFRKVREKYPDAIILSLSINTDGARVYNTTNKSLWPLQMYQNFLRPHKRYVPENIIVAAMHEGKH